MATRHLPFNTMKRLLLITLLILIGLCASVSGQTFYNPTTVAFESPSHDIVTLYRVQYFLAGTVVDLTTVPLAQWDVAKGFTVVGSPGPPIVYNLFLKDVYVFLPFGKSYVLRLLACQDALCSQPSEVTRELVRYTYCKGTDHTVQPMTITQVPPPVGAVAKYVSIDLAVQSVRPVHAISISLVGAGNTPAFYFTGNDMRGPIVLSVGPLPRAGRYLMNISAADEAGCSTSQASQFLTIR